MLFERKKSNWLKPQDVTYNGQVILSSSSVKFLGITFDSALTFQSHFCTVSTLQPMALHLYPHLSLQILHPFIVHFGAPATCTASPDIQLSWERIQTRFISRALSILSFIHNDRKQQHAYLPPIHDRNLYLVKRWYRHTMQHNHRAISTITFTTNTTFTAATIHHLN